MQSTTIGIDEQQGAQAKNEDNGVSEPPIKLVHVLNPGEREYLSPNLIGVQNIAMTFLPKSLNFINVIDAYREIVNGVRYEIVLNAQDMQLNDKDKDKDLVCRLVILEKPWIRSDWGDKYRELQHSNCTRDSHIEQGDSDAAASNFVESRSKIANDKYNAESSQSYYNAVTRNELNAAEMHKLEAQIIPDTPTATTPSPTMYESVDMTTMQSIELETTTLTMPPELSDNEKKWLDDFLAVGALNFEQMLREQRDKQQQQQQQQQETKFNAADFNQYPVGEEQTDVEQVKTS